MGAEAKSPKKKKSKDESKKKSKDEKKEKRSSSRSKSASRDEERRLRRERRKQEKEKRKSSEGSPEATPPAKSDPFEQPVANNYASIFNVTSLAQSAILTEDFKHRISELQFKINSQLIPQRQLILNQIHRVHSKINEITNIKEGYALY
jgi:phage protein D